MNILQEKYVVMVQMVMNVMHREYRHGADNDARPSLNTDHHLKCQP